MNYIKFSANHQETQPSDKKREAWILFPPFPGLQGKNEDIAKVICNENQVDVFVFNYTGLSSNPNESFSFITAVEESIAFAQDLLKLYDKLNFVGHSWGGLVSLNIFNKILTSEQRGLMILIAPFTEFPKDGSIESWLIPMAEKQEHFSFSHKDPLDVRNNFFSVETAYAPRQHLENLKTENNQITLIEAINDHDVPNHSTESLYQLLGSKQTVQRFKLKDDHCFTQNRNAIINVIRIAIETTILTPSTH